MPIQPERMLLASARALPVMKYVVGVGGMVSVLALVKAYGLDFQVAAFGLLVVAIITVFVIVIARLEKLPRKHFLLPAIALAWAFTVLVIAAASLLVSSAFFQWPRKVPALFGETTVLSNRAAIERFSKLHQSPIDEVLRIINSRAFSASLASNSMKLQFEVFGRNQRGHFARLGADDALKSVVDHYTAIAHPLSNGHLYVFQIDSAGMLFWLFPRNTYYSLSEGANPVVAGIFIHLPSETRAFYLDRVAGTERLFAILAASPWPELEAALRNASMLSKRNVGKDDRHATSANTEPSRGPAGVSEVISETLLSQLRRQLVTSMVCDSGKADSTGADASSVSGPIAALIEKSFLHVE